MGSVGFMLLFQAFLIFLNAVFASAEIAILSVNDQKLAKLASEGNSRAKRLMRLTSQPAKFLATIQVAITLSGFLGSAFAADNFSDRIVNWLINLGVTIPRPTLDTLSVIIITLILSYFTLIFGELVPKRIAMKKAEKMALGVSGLIGAISFLFAPIVWLLSVSTNGILRLIGIDPNEQDDDVSEEEIRLMVDAGSEKGTIDVEEKEFIQNVFEFDDLSAGEIATHRTEISVLWMEESMDEWAFTINKTRHTLYPVCEDSQDNIIGILNAKDYFRLEDKSRESVMENAVKPAYFVPENIKADILFKNMKQNGSTLAVVLDEYGGCVGIVTLNDLVECLVGDLLNNDPEETSIAPVVEKKEEVEWVIHGNVDLDDIEEETGLKIDRGESDTFTGLVFNSLGMIPDDGEQDIKINLGRLAIQVTKIEDHTISEAAISLLPDDSDAEKEAEK